MPKNLLIDLNVVIDVFLERAGYEASRDVIALGQHDDYRLFLSAHAVTTFAYLLESAKVPKTQISRHIDWLLQTFRIVPVDGALLRTALASQVRDYEDAVVEGAAITCNGSTIVTRNLKDFKASVVLAAKPEDYLKAT
ncbi:MAG TPA: PIN domain-containing protein [Candidatus Saccharimonadales bacterium]|jgi:predicted nucleic acid-binding protein